MLLTVIVPVYNEEDVIEIFYKRTKDVVDSLPYDTELLFVNDGSTDSTLNILLSLQEKDLKIKVKPPLIWVLNLLLIFWMLTKKRAFLGFQSILRKISSFRVQGFWLSQKFLVFQ